MRLEVGQSAPVQDAGGHIAVLDALIGENGGSELPVQVHAGQALQVEGGNGVVAFPQRLELGGRHSPQRGK
mgnify:CR=1 FL=1